MKCEIAVRGANSADLTRDLISWLVEEPSLRGRVFIVECDPPAYTLGPVAVALEAALEPGGAVTALATIVITWLRCRTGKVSLSIWGRNSRPDLNVTAERVKNLDAEGIRDLIVQISDVLSGDQPEKNALEGEGHGGA
jgi:hypothetical protein